MIDNFLAQSLKKKDGGVKSWLSVHTD
jgi:hypothetical protein